MSKTRVVFFVLIGIVLLVVAGSFILQRTGVPSLKAPETLNVRVVVALPVEPFVREAANRFNAEGHTLDGNPIQVTVIPMDGLDAMGRWEREEMDPLPTVWIPDSRYLVELVNATYKERRGRDIFLTGGEYRARPIATSLFCWGIWQSRDEVLREHFGEDVTWRDIHDAAITRGGWPELGGEPEWGYFKLVVPNPRKNVGGLMAMVAAAGEYYGKTRIEVADVTNPEFQQWLAELMGAVTDFSSLGSYSVENLALFGYSMGDGGQLLESDLITNMAGIQTRWWNRWSCATRNTSPGSTFRTPSGWATRRRLRRRMPRSSSSGIFSRPRFSSCPLATACARPTPKWRLTAKTAPLFSGKMRAL